MKPKTKKRWVPSENEIYYYIEIDSWNYGKPTVCYDRNYDMLPNDETFKMNCFRTKKQAQVAAKAIKKILKGG